MRITCNACNAQYNLPDEKVRGRRVKVRCKRCSEGIVVDGTMLAEAPDPSDFEDEATRVMDSPLSTDARMWTVNLSEDEQGDMTDEELIAGWQAGIVTEDAYVWRDGMDDWAALLDVPELVSLLADVPRPEPEAPPPEEAAAPEAATPEEAAAPEAATSAAEEPQPAFSADPFAPAAPVDPDPLGFNAEASALPAPPPPSGPAPLPLPPAPNGSVASQQFSNLFDAPAPRREPPRTDASTAREENSVLFSLDALKEAAASPPSPSAPRRAAQPAGRVHEDILTMGGPTIGSLDQAPLIDVEIAPPAAPVAASIPPGSGAPAGMPMTSAPPAAQRSTGVLIAAVLITALLVGGGLFAAQNFMGKKPAIAANADSESKDSKGTEGSERTATPEPSASASASGTSPAASASVAPSASTTALAAGTPPSTKGGGSSKRRGGSGGGGKKKGDKKDKEKKDDKSDKKDKEKEVKPEEIDLGVAEGQFNTAAAKASLGGAAAAAKGCAKSGGPSGKGKVQVTFVPSGRVTSANVVSGPFGGTPVGGCVARAFRKARVPKFTGAPVTVAKSFRIPKKKKSVLDDLIKE